MSRKQTLIKGTFILTITGFTTRFMGFFYRIFLSHTFGEEGVGLYQLVFPVYALCFSLTCAGIELAISHLTARYLSLNKKRETQELLYTGLILSVSSSVLVTLIIQRLARFLSVTFLHDIRCAPLLTILSYAFPFAAAHSCICGYYLGMKQTKIPAISQLLEQTARISSVYLIFLYGIRHGMHFNVVIAVVGLIIGEITSSFYCLHRIFEAERDKFPSRLSAAAFLRHSRDLLIFSIPLTGSRVLLNILQSVEAVSIPLRLRMHGMSVSDSLSTYGVLTGMALPCILFPSAITNSVSTMLLPTVAEIQAADHSAEMQKLVRKVMTCCVSLGCICCAGLLITGRWIGQFLFHSTSAGIFITTLAWMCPFLYTNSTLISIINGLGKTTLSFLINSVSLGVRIASVWFLIPVFGIKGYLWGLLASQICTFAFCGWYLYEYLGKRRDIVK